MSNWQQITLGDLQTHERRKASVPPQGSRTSISGWQQMVLGDLLTRVRRKVSVEDGVTYPAVSVQMYGRGLGEKEPFVGGVSKYTTLNAVRENDVVLRTITAFEAPAGVARAEHGGTHVSGVFITYEVDQSALPEFLGLYFQTPAFWDEMQNRASGTVLRRKTISDASFRAIPFALPPLPTQKRIIKAIGAVDHQIAALNAESEALEGILASLRSDLPETDHQPISDVLLGIDSGKSVQAGAEASTEDEYRILKLSAVQRGWFKPSEAKTLGDNAAFSPSHVVKNGDLLITRANTPERVGFVAVAKNVPEGTFMPDLIWRLRVDESRVRTDYLEHALSSCELRTSISGTASGTSKSMVKINKRGFGTVRVPIPSLPEQGNYVRRCDAVAGGIMATRAEEARLRRVRAGLLLGLLDRTIEIESAELGV
ncbi:restriction endonuclease subunit S [Streptomyces lydicus]|uniref:restriction endonuclease subunit S n=1 Tax=Streptomyces lydicus TaxID=47763 RepID=UPI0036BFD05B